MLFPSLFSQLLLLLHRTQTLAFIQICSRRPPGCSRRPVACSRRPLACFRRPCACSGESALIHCRSLLALAVRCLLSPVSRRPPGCPRRSPVPVSRFSSVLLLLLGFSGSPSPSHVSVFLFVCGLSGCQNSHLPLRRRPTKVAFLR